MAYSNWGATVLRNGEPRLDKEDVGVWDTDESSLPSGARIFANILKNRERDCERWDYHSHHAVLGDGIVRLCGYKASAELWVLDSGTGEGHRIEIDDFKSFKKEKDKKFRFGFEHRSLKGKIGAGENIWNLDEWEYSIEYEENPESVKLELIEPDGTCWTAECGYGIGAGFDH